MSMPIRACALLGGLSLAGAAALLPAAEEAALPQARLPVPVSINALMVTLIDHSAHYLWDYANQTRFMGDEEWLAIEYYGIQLAAAAPLITLGGTGPADAGWVADARWTAYAGQMMEGAQMAMNAARLQDVALLQSAGDRLIEACEGCHEDFKPDLPTEGLEHDPYYDHLYHMFLAEPEPRNQPDD